MTDIELETIKLRLEGARQAIARSRYTFLVSIIACVAILVTVWNAYMSPDSEFALQPHWSHDKQFSPDMQKERLADLEQRHIPADKVTEVTDHVQQEIVSEWVKNQVISVGLLGIRISVGDFSVLGSLSLLIASIWFFFSIRAENLSIGNLLKHAYKFPDWDDRYLVYQGIVNHVVFLAMGRGDRPISDFRTEDIEGGSSVPLMRGLVKLLILLPAITIFLVVAADLWTLFRSPSPFRPSSVPLWKVLDSSDVWWLLGTDGFALLLFLATVVISVKILKFAGASGELLGGFRTHLISSHRELADDLERVS
jgi:hypothetical protein